MSVDVPTARFLALIVLAYFVGGIPFSLGIGRLVRGVDIRTHGSRNPGAANVWRTVGRPWGLIAGACDAAKGAVMVLLAWGWGLDDARACWVGAAAVLGHNFSPWLRLRGGKGGATTVGMLACFILPELVVVFLIWLAGWLLLPGRRFLWSMLALSATPLLVVAAGRLPFFPWPPGSEPRSLSVLIATTLLIALVWWRVLPGMRPAGPTPHV